MADSLIPNAQQEQQQQQREEEDKGSEVVEVDQVTLKGSREAKVGDVRVTIHPFQHGIFPREYMYVHGKLPHALVVALHPFGGSPERTLERYSALVKKGFSILLPRGVENSWNAGACCGKALALGLDDAGFIKAVTAHVLQERFRERPGMKVYLTGFSNGAFMASQIALTALAHGESWIKALAMNAGYSYDQHMYRATVENGKVTAENAFPVLALHGTSDTAVRVEGCCANDNSTGSQCCCQIYSPRCMSFHQSFESWKKTYRCQSNAWIADNVTMEVATLPDLKKRFQDVCYGSTGCLAPLEFCALPQVGHRLDNFVPIDQIVTDFFYQDYVSSKAEGVLKPGGARKHNAGNPHASSPADARHEPIKGYLIMFGFIFAFFYFLARMFTKKPLRDVMPQRVSTERDRERIPLTRV